MRREKLYKICQNKSLMVKSDVLFRIQNEQSVSGSPIFLCSEHSKNVLKIFCSAIELYLHAFCRAFHTASFKIKFMILSFP